VRAKHPTFFQHLAALVTGFFHERFG